MFCRIRVNIFKISGGPNLFIRNKNEVIWTDNIIYHVYNNYNYKS